jgi:hypothetical protein
MPSIQVSPVQSIALTTEAEAEATAGMVRSFSRIPSLRWRGLYRLRRSALEVEVGGDDVVGGESAVLKREAQEAFREDASD